MRTETIIFWLPLAAIVAHIFEEFVWPGGFAAWYRGYRPEIASSIRPKFLFWVNAALVFAGLSVGFDGPSWIGPPFFIALTTLLAANALFHLRAVLKTRIYSPGVVTGVLLYIPLALFGYWYMPQARHTSLLTVLIATALGSTYQLFSLANHRRRAAQASTRGTGHKRSAGEPPAVDPAAKLAEGCKILGSVLLPHGFHFELREVGKSSGGYFAWGEYVKGDRRLEIHFRYSPGHITYHFGDRSIS
ncbi:MAG TPA: HXXEE domain-containing protein, partial [Thermoanaerobaculia bacterium]|nr:HXXEE domain-containing protein [Thermoanaerobaculia bacterium]